MFVVLMPLVAGLIVFILLAPLLGFAKRGKSSSSFAMILTIAGISLSVIRMTCYWALFYMARSGHQEIGYLPLIFLLFPEAILLQENGQQTIVQGILFSGLLAIGSFLWAAILGWSMTRGSQKVS
jgi:hypothetical protein